jgi:hypothetical protein
MSYEQNVAWKGKNLIIGCLAVLVLGISIIVAFNLKTSRQGGTTGRPVPPEPLVRLPPELVKDLVSKGMSTIALMEENDHVKQVVELFSDGRCEGGIQDLEESTVQVSLLRSPELKTFPPSGTTGKQVPPEPLVRLPPELVKDLVSKGVSTIALMEENDHVKQVVGLFPDGRCEGGIQDLEESTVQVSLLRSPEFGTSNFVVEPARALSCSRGCESCSSGNCRKSLGSCFNCQ